MSVRRCVVELLTEGQRRHLAASLTNVAAALGRIESIAGRSGPTPPRPLPRCANDLPPGFDQAIGPSLNRARAALAELVAALDLQGPDASAYRYVQALVMSSLVVLEDAGIRNLRGYGEIHPSLPDLVEPALSRIHAQVTAIGEALTPGTRTTRSDDALR